MKYKSFIAIVCIIFCICLAGCSNGDLKISGKWQSYGLIEDGEKSIVTYDDVGLETPSDSISIDNDGEVVYHGEKTDTKGTIKDDGENHYNLTLKYSGTDEVSYDVEIKDGYLVIHEEGLNDLVFSKK